MTERIRDLAATREWMNSRALAMQLHIRCDELERGRASCTFEPPDDWRNPNGSIPGAMLAAFADHVAGFAAVSVTDDDDYTATVELDTRFLRAAFKVPVTGVATVVRRGLRLAFVTFEMHESTGTLVVDGTASFFIESGLGNAHPIGRGRPDDGERSA